MLWHSEQRKGVVVWVLNAGLCWFLMNQSLVVYAVLLDVVAGCVCVVPSTIARVDAMHMLPTAASAAG